MKAKIQVGSKVQIRTGQSWADGEWGIVRQINHDEYIVAPAGSDKVALTFGRNEIRTTK